MASTDALAPEGGMTVAALVHRCHSATRQLARSRIAAARKDATDAAYALFVQTLTVFALSSDHRDLGVVVCPHNYPHVDVQALMSMLGEQGLACRMGLVTDDRACANTALVGVSPSCTDAERAASALKGKVADAPLPATDHPECLTVVVQNTWCASVRLRAHVPFSRFHDVVQLAIVAQGAEEGVAQ